MSGWRNKKREGTSLLLSKIATVSKIKARWKRVASETTLAMKTLNSKQFLLQGNIVPLSAEVTSKRNKYPFLQVKTFMTKSY